MDKQVVVEVQNQGEGASMKECDTMGIVMASHTVEQIRSHMTQSIRSFETLKGGVGQSIDVMNPQTSRRACVDE